MLSMGAASKFVKTEMDVLYPAAHFGQTKGQEKLDLFCPFVYFW